MTRAMNVLLLACGLMGNITPAQSKGGEAGMTFHGTLIEPPACTIEGGDLIDVNFGEQVGINKVDGKNYRRGFPHKITCEGTGNWALTLSLKGERADFDDHALATDRTDLGIRVYQNDKPFTPNSTLNIDISAPPTLEAVPVKNIGATLTKGTFEAWATLQADYQ